MSALFDHLEERAQDCAIDMLELLERVLILPNLSFNPELRDLQQEAGQLIAQIKGRKEAAL